MLVLAAPLLVTAACAEGGDVVPPTTPTCPDAPTLATLSDHAEALRGAAALLAGHLGEREAVGFFLFPHLAVQRSSVFAGPLVMVCSERLRYDEYCEEEDGLCSQIECTGEGASWIMHFRLEAPVPDEVTYDAAEVHAHWVDRDDGITFSSASQAGAWSLSGAGRMDTDSLEVEETYPQLVAGATTTLTSADTSAGQHDGAIAIDGTVVATQDPTTGAYVAVDACR